jgi:hypothetical protein
LFGLANVLKMKVSQLLCAIFAAAAAATPPVGPTSSSRKVEGTAAAAATPASPLRPIWSGLAGDDAGTLFGSVPVPSTSSLRALNTVWWDLPLGDYNDLPAHGNGQLTGTSNIVIDANGTIYFVAIEVDAVDSGAITLTPVLHAYAVVTTSSQPPQLTSLFTWALTDIGNATLPFSDMPYTSPIALAGNGTTLLLTLNLCTDECDTTLHLTPAVAALDLVNRRVRYTSLSTGWGLQGPLFLQASGFPASNYAADPYSSFVYAAFCALGGGDCDLHVVAVRVADGLLMQSWHVGSAPPACDGWGSMPWQVRFPSPNPSSGLVESMWLLTHSPTGSCNVQIELTGGTVVDVDGRDVVPPPVATDGQDDDRDETDPTFYAILSPSDYTGKTRYLVTNNTVVKTQQQQQGNGTTAWSWLAPVAGSKFGGAVLDESGGALYVACAQPNDRAPLSTDGIFWDAYAINTTDGTTLFHAVLPPHPWTVATGALVGGPAVNASEATGESVIFAASALTPDLYMRGVQSFSAVPAGQGQGQERKRRAGRRRDSSSTSSPSSYPWAKVQRASFTNPSFMLIDGETFWAVGPQPGMLTVVNGYHIQVLVDA